MSDTARLLHDAAHKLFAEHVTPESLRTAEDGAWQEDLWDAVEEAGFPDLLVDRETPAEERAKLCATLLKAAARHLAPIPLGETVLTRGLLAARGFEAPSGPLSFSLLDGHSHTHGDHSHLEGTAKRVVYGRDAKGVLLIAPHTSDAVFVAVRRGKIAPGKNIASEARDDLTFADTAGASVPGITQDYLTALGAALRSIQIAGALERVLMQTVEYARTRVQFGKPIAAFQAIQQQLAILAGQTAVAGSAAEAAIADWETPEKLALSAAVAKVRCGEAAGIAASIAHQVHGAIGITYEHTLHFATRRLWSWRAEFGSEAFWSERIGQSVAAAGAEAYWPSVTA